MPQNALLHDLLILGSQNAKKADQGLDRSEVRPVQILRKTGELLPVNFFNTWGRVGVSAMAWQQQSDAEWLISINDGMRRLNLETGAYKEIELPGTGDLHDIHFIDGLLWISNTEFDEAIAIDPATDRITQRIPLKPFREHLDRSGLSADDRVRDRFHLNQVCQDLDGQVMGLIHHISGWQFSRIVFEMLVKRQGNGGVIDLKTGKAHNLKLQSPHSVRLIDGDYWVADSGAFELKIFDRDWRFKDKIHLGGFTRGIAFSESEDRVYTGISATRKRYLKVIPSEKYLSNRLMINGISDHKTLAEITLPNIEQVDNVFILEPGIAERLLSLPSS